MTIIAALRDKKTKTVYLGADFQVSAHLDITDSKIFEIGDLLIGGAGNLVDLQTVKYHLELVEPHSDEDPLKYMITKVVPIIKVLVKEHMSSDATTMESEFIMIYKGRIFIMGQDFSVFESTLDVGCIGSGSDICTGALIMGEKEKDKKLLLRKALKLTSEHAYGCGKKIEIRRQKYD